jgi:DNA-binding helix-hairpin-helix protein with protein kinase domain
VSDPRDVVLASDPPRTIRLGNKPIGRGGQAVVYVTEADPALAVKLYYEPAADVERRLEGMLRLAHPDEFLTKDGASHPELAWPTAVVRDVDNHQVIGYAMRRVGRPDFFALGVLFSRPQRREALSEISWRFLVGVSRNLAGLVATLHDRNLVLGDVSHANIVVSQEGRLTFLDCDSMQFVAPTSGERFPCLVLTAEYAAPELQRAGHRVRTPESDCFSLAVLVCRLLLLGDHPFMGVRASAPEDDESGTTDNIRDGYSYLVRPEEMRIPSNSFDPGLMPPKVLQLARRTFGEGHSDLRARPQAAEWLAALEEAQTSLSVCPTQRLHVYGSHLAACPWHERASAGFSDPFVAPGPRVRVPGATTPPSQPAPSVPTVPEKSEEWSGAEIALAVFVVIVLVLLLL